jgi:hypothetical protein
MKKETYKDIVTDELLKNTLDHNAHTGFLEDYRVFSCLLKKYKPASLFEIGSNTGNGINVAKTAVPELDVYSLDLDYDTMMKNSKQYPIGANGEDRVGSNCRFKYTQLRGDSLLFDYKKYKCEAYYIDGEHDKLHAYHETFSVLECKPKLIIWHDTDMEPLMAGRLDAFEDSPFGSEYELIRVIDTRISYAIRK